MTFAYTLAVETKSPGNASTRCKTGPVVGAVVFSGQANAVTDVNGSFTITVPSNAVLEISCLGYAPQQVYLNGRNQLDFILEEDAEVLQEAVALGYGAQTRKRTCPPPWVS